MNFGGSTQPYAVLGHPIGHSLSPAMHNASFRALGLDAAYLAFDVAPDRLMRVLPAMADMGFGGVNLTVPLKEVAYRGLKDLDRSAALLGAVNTVEIRPEGLRGHNTDGAGFLLALKEAFELEVQALDVFVLGSGGAGRAVALTCAEAGAERVTVADLDASRADGLAAELGERFPETNTSAAPPEREAWQEAANQAHLVVQATPVGMKPDDDSLLPRGAFRTGQYVYDLVYMYPRTAFLRNAEKAGARAANGLGMLLHQGARAFTIWTGKQADAAAMRAALEAAVYGPGVNAHA